MSQLNKAEAIISSLKSMLNELSWVNANPEIAKRVEKCQSLIQRLETAENGILTKFRLDGQVALVTGGGQGIGRGFAHGLGEAGCKVAVADIVLSRAETVATELEAKGIEAIAIQVDVSKKEDVERMVETVLAKWGDLHIAFNNAGIATLSDTEAKHMLNKCYGKIINTSSISAVTTNHPEQHADYNVSKAGVTHLTRTLGAEWARQGVRVNAILPGYINTTLLESIELQSLKDSWISQIPMGRLGQVEDLVGAAIYLASPVSDYMTGFNLLVDGGFTC